MAASIISMVCEMMCRAAARLEAVDADLRHAAARALVETDGHVELLHLAPRRARSPGWCSMRPLYGIGAEEARAHAQLLARVAHLLDGELDRLHRQHGHAEEAVGIGLAVVGEPAVVGAAHGGGQLGLLDRAGEEADARIEERGVDAVQVHVGNAGVRIEAALAAVDVLHGVLGHSCSPGRRWPR